MSDGQIDYLTALENHYSQGVTPQNNAVVPLLEALGRSGIPPNQPRDGVTDRLGMPPLPDAGDYLQPGNTFKKWATTQGDETGPALEIPLEHPWKAAEHPKVVEWLNANEKPLAKVIEASKRSRFFYPYNAGYRVDSLIGVMLPYLVPTREAGQRLDLPRTPASQRGRRHRGARRSDDSASSGSFALRGTDADRSPGRLCDGVNGQPRPSRPSPPRVRFPRLSSGSGSPRCASCRSWRELPTAWTSPSA